MEFLDINLTKDTRILLYAIHSPFNRCILKKTILFSGFKNHYKKICKTRKHDKHFVKRNYEGSKPNKSSSLRRLEFMPRTLTENDVQEFHLWFVFWRQLVVDSRLLCVCYDCQVYLVHLSQVVICYYSCWVSLSVVVAGSRLSSVCCPGMGCLLATGVTCCSLFHFRCVPSCLCTVKWLQLLPTLQRKSHLCVPRKGIAGLSPNFHIHVSVIDLFIPRICPHIFLQQNRQTDRGIYKPLTDTRMWKSD
jgi:hypothetical protein